MNRAKMLYTNRLLFFSKFILTGFLLFFLFFSTNRANAQDSPSNEQQWKSVGGKIVASGYHKFNTGWYLGGNGLYWKDDEQGRKIDPRHTPEEVQKDVVKKKGQITVQGPDFLALFFRMKGGVTPFLQFQESGKTFWVAPLGRQEWQRDSQGNYKWYGNRSDFDPSKNNNGWIPYGKTYTFDVMVSSGWSEGGSWRGYAAPKEVEYEFWYFPREGGEIISMGEVKEIDDINKIYSGPGCGVIKEGKVFDDTSGKWLTPGDPVFYDHSLTTGKNENATTTLNIDMGDTIVRLKQNTRIVLHKKITKKKSGGIFLAVGRLLSLFKRNKVNGFAVETYNWVAGVEGTEFETAYDPDTGETKLSVFEGTVRLECTKGESDPVMVNAGMQATMDNNCNSTLSILDPDKNTPAKAGWEVIGEPDDIDDKREGDIVRIAPNSDSRVYAYAYRNWDKANWGAYNIFTAGWHPTGGESRAYLKFALSGVNPDKVGKATLKLFHNHTGGNNSLSVGIHAVTGTWQEGGGTYHSGQIEKPAAPGEISWVNQPSFDPSPLAQFNPGGGVAKWVEVDITPLVKAWLSGKPNFGLVITSMGPLGPGTGESVYGFYSREFEDAEKRPVLVLSGSGSVEQPGATSLPIFEDFSSGSGNWQLDGQDIALTDGKLYWNTGNHLFGVLNKPIPMENVVIEFDGYTETNGINVYLHNDDNEGYIVFSGEWYNTKSGSDVGKSGQNRELMNSKVWEAKRWHHYKIVRNGDLLQTFCDGRKIYERTVTSRFSGTGYLKFNSYATRFGIDNVKVTDASGSLQQNVLSCL